MHRQDDSLPIIGVSLGDAALTELIIDQGSVGLAALRDVLDITGNGVLYLGGDRFRTKSTTGARYLDSLFSAQWLLSRLPNAAVFTSTSPEVEHPFNYSRRTLTVDHYSQGRLGVVIGTRDRRSMRVDRGNTSWTGTPTSPELAAEFLVVLRELWNSWPRESIISDKSKGVFANAPQIISIDHEGDYSVAGPLNTPSSMQGEPPIGWHLTLGAREVAAAQDVEVLISGLGSVPTVQQSGVPVRLAEISGPSFESEYGQANATGAFTAVLLRANTLRELSELARTLSVSSSAVSADSSAASTTLREKLGLESRRLEIAGYSPAFN